MVDYFTSSMRLKCTSKSCLGGASHSDQKRRRSLLNVVTLSLLPKCNIYTVAFGFTPDIHHLQDNWGTSKCSPNDFFSSFFLLSNILHCPPSLSKSGHASPAHLEDGDEKIPEDEAICRICFEELCGQSSFKLECSCRGALRLMHVECAVKWFGNKGNKKCDVCAQEIFNLPATLFRLQSSAQGDDSQQHIGYNSSSQLTR